jgi:hypothetical protein
MKDPAVKDIALLAAVAREHLVSGLETVKAEGKVAFGTCTWEPFVGLKTPQDGEPSEVFIYESDAADRKGPPRVKWVATYLGIVSSKPLGAHPAGMKYRPASTNKYPRDNAGHWFCFWEVKDLRELSPQEQIPVSALFSATGKKFNKRFVPHGPVAIAA